MKYELPNDITPPFPIGEPFTLESLPEDFRDAYLLEESEVPYVVHLEAKDVITGFASAIRRCLNENNERVTQISAVFSSNHGPWAWSADETASHPTMEILLEVLAGQLMGETTYFSLIDPAHVEKESMERLTPLTVTSHSARTAKYVFEDLNRVSALRNIVTTLHAGAISTINSCDSLKAKLDALPDESLDKL